jgi:hypothetical protein
VWVKMDESRDVSIGWRTRMVISDAAEAHLHPANF